MNKDLRNRIFFLLFILTLFLDVVESRAQVYVKNNLLYDATLTPNLGIEVGIDSVWSVGLNAGARIWPRNDRAVRKYRHFILAPEVRRWFSHTGSGHYVGADILYTHFNVGGMKIPLYESLKHKRKQGDAVALGPFYGYKWRFGSHWGLEAEAGVDVGYAWYDIYVPGTCDKLGSDKGAFLMPRLGINVVYQFGKK